MRLSWGEARAPRVTVEPDVSAAGDERLLAKRVEPRSL